MNTSRINREWHLWMQARKAGYPGQIIWSDNEQGKQKTAKYTVVGEHVRQLGPYIWTEESETGLDAWLDEGGA